MYKYYEHKLLSDRQHAFGKELSCETQLITIINDWANILEAGGRVDIHIGFREGLNTPAPELLKCKLHGYSKISGKTLVFKL